MSETPNGLLPYRFERWFSNLCSKLSGLLVNTGLSPNQITFLSLGFGFFTGIFLAFGYMAAALIFGIIMGVLDILDGQLALLTHQTTAFGGILDSTIDRYNEFFLYLGLLIYFLRVGQPFWVIICILILVGSLMVSYVKARAEGTAIDCPVGYLQRSERLVLLAVAILFQGWILKLVLLILSMMTHITVIQRLVYLKNYKKPDYTLIVNGH